MNKNKSDREVVAVWYDEASGEAPAWVVSIDERTVLSDGRIETEDTRTYGAYGDDKDAAIAAAKALGAAKRLPVEEHTIDAEQVWLVGPVE